MLIMTSDFDIESNILSIKILSNIVNLGYFFDKEKVERTVGKVLFYEKLEWFYKIVSLISWGVWNPFNFNV